MGRGALIGAVVFGVVGAVGGLMGYCFQEEETYSALTHAINAGSTFALLGVIVGLVAVAVGRAVSKRTDGKD
jgi:hypothetical protein